jgi:hypothetical protein
LIRGWARTHVEVSQWRSSRWSQIDVVHRGFELAFSIADLFDSKDPM